MKSPRAKILSFALAPICLLACVSGSVAETARAQVTAPITVRVDATSAPRHLLHTELRIPIKPGKVTLVYPKWIPGEHGPTGPIDNLVGLTMSAGGKPVPWRRDDADMYAFHCDVPQGAAALDVAFDYIVPTSGIFTGGPSASDKLLDLNWNQVVLYPAGLPSDAWTFNASLRLPAGWNIGTALPVSARAGDSITFAPVSLTTLVDSPVVAGEYHRSIPLGEAGGAAHHIELVADSRAALDMPKAQVDAYRRLVAEAHALFGARHYSAYHFLYTLSDHVGDFGLEHHESSDNRLPERTLLDPDMSKWSAGLLPHEFVHSWNGKYRRPRGLATPDYQSPMKGDMLWVYEGLTEYLGEVLTVRSGLWSSADWLDVRASVAANMDNRPGRAWRPLLDTAVSAQTIFRSPAAWSSLRRAADFYDEGALVWLEADVIIRKQTGGKRSLDDFCQRFHGGKSGEPQIAPYTYDDVLKMLGEVAPYDWRGFFDARINATSPRAPLGGLVEGGYKLVYDETPSDAFKTFERWSKGTDLSLSLGLKLAADGRVVDAIPSLPAAAAGIGPGMRVIAVDGRRYAPERLHDAIRAAKTGSAPIELIVENGDYLKPHRIDYHGGERYPHLVRDPGRTDWIVPILSPRASARPAAASK